MKIIGTTTNGKIVVKDIAKLYFEQGLPLVIIFDRMEEHRMIPSFPHLFKELKGNGMSSERIYHLLSESMVDTYGSAFRDVVISRLKSMSL